MAEVKGLESLGVSHSWDPCGGPGAGGRWDAGTLGLCLVVQRGGQNSTVAHPPIPRAATLNGIV